MQIYALDESGFSVIAHEAVRHKNYLCIECKKKVRLRGGQWKQLHFYHSDSSAGCRLGGKSLLHLQTQNKIKNTLAPEVILLEKHFPEINRIADVVWPEKKIIFEVQCSPISPEEIRNRNHDYSCMGYIVVWILHDRQFNRLSLSSAEIFLLTHPHYFTNIDSRGKGMIYDQYSTSHSGKRKKKSPRLPIHVKRFTRIDSRSFFKKIPEERKKWGIAFEGDISMRENLPLYLKKKSLWVRLHRLLLNSLLEKTTS